MNNPGSQRISVQQTRRRLFVLLLRAYIIVMLVAVIFTSVSTFLLVHNSTNEAPMAMPSNAPSSLEAYYSGRGSWDGVDDFIQTQLAGPPGTIRSEWDEITLLDAQGHIILYKGSPDHEKVGSLYKESSGEMRTPIITDGQPIGMLIMQEQDPGGQPMMFNPLLISLILTTAFLAILTVVIGIFLTRRVVEPLAEVIAAAQSVTTGNLSSRVSVSGSDDLRALSDSFNQMAGSLERNDMERREMLADIAHELRTPLSVIRGRLEGIVDGIYPANRSQIMPVLEEIHLIERLIEDLHVLTLAESRQLNFNYQPVHLGRLAKHVVSLFQAKAAEKNVRLEVKTKTNLPYVEADLQRTEQVIVNLLGNALRYVPAGGIIMVEVTRDTEEVLFTISDTGPGIAEEDIKHIFDRFWRSEKSRSRSSGGTGLGLTIARQLIQTQQGRIWACNLPQGGLQVGFALPVKSNELSDWITTSQ